MPLSGIHRCRYGTPYHLTTGPLGGTVASALSLITQANGILENRSVEPIGEGVF